MAMDLRQESWADMTALNTMPLVDLEVQAVERKTAKGSDIAIRLHNSSQHIAFFERATISAAPDGGEILPIEYDDNYITVYPGETAEIHGTLPQGAKAGWVKLEGYNTRATAVPIN
jgi:exo-1,4-beta-D-glucosaminidase